MSLPTFLILVSIVPHFDKYCGGCSELRVPVCLNFDVLCFFSAVFSFEKSCKVFLFFLLRSLTIVIAAALSAVLVSSLEKRSRCNSFYFVKAGSSVYCNATSLPSMAHSGAVCDCKSLCNLVSILYIGRNINFNNIINLIFP